MTMHQNSEEPEHQLFEAIALLKNAEEAHKFFHDLCTPAEISAMADRWRVVHPIKAGVPYRQIYQDTGVSSTTVGRVARFSGSWIAIQDVSRGLYWDTIIMPTQP